MEALLHIFVITFIYINQAVLIFLPLVARAAMARVVDFSACTVAVRLLTRPRLSVLRLSS